MCGWVKARQGQTAFLQWVGDGADPTDPATLALDVKDMLLTPPCLYITLVIIRTKYTRARQNVVNVYA